jgi:hypothetical protein
LKWLDRDGAIWYASKLIKDGNSFDDACYAALHIDKYCVNGIRINKHQEKKFRSEIWLCMRSSKFLNEYTN